ncbi:MULTISPECIES: DUF3558 domain-containing protein [unclassified Nocardioides]|uniref:DUF3558 domain-containing protein n=1 Tax=unclassified Nocardioides TaxID=2615069 RepID=UPI0009F0CD11|nr:MULTISPECIES: DUF3558 domain-containing protein [unclassified Nocardioides]GAW51940.1 hypothetical protein PD653B2_4289 [Nocardioides sp. PD653-B2]GAW56454.1 hypothetical protein PD653_3891 [Nocardioides sp. PD653]
MKPALAALVAVLLLGAGCSGSDDGPEASKDPTDAAMSALESSMASAEAPIETDLPHPCDQVTKADAEDLVGGQVTVSRIPESGAATVMTCSYTSVDLDHPSVTLQTTVDGGSLKLFVQLTTATGGKAYALDVPGTDEAALIRDEDPDFPTTTAVTELDGTIHTVIVIDGTEEQQADLARSALIALIS